MNSVPTPFSDSTLIVPFIISTMFLVIAIPRPVLPYLFLVLLSSWEKASKIFGMNSLSMPTPVSLMRKRRVDCSSKTAMRSMLMVTLPPGSVNLMALERILMSTSLSFMSSPM